MAKITHRSAKSKGRDFQYLVCHWIAGLFDIEFKQDDDLCPIHSRDASLNGTDIVFRDKNLYNKFPFDIECKRTEKLSLYPAISQAKDNNKQEDRDWLVIHKKNHTEPIVIMSMNAFTKLFKKSL
jgi:hypothetical protein